MHGHLNVKLENMSLMTTGDNIQTTVVNNVYVSLCFMIITE